MSKKAIITVVIAVVVLAVVGGAVWYAQKQFTPSDDLGAVNPSVAENNNLEQQPSNELEGDVANGGDEIDTSDWQTYRNEEYGFEIKLPKEILPFPWSACKNSEETLIPAVAFEDKDGVYIRSEYYFNKDLGCRKENVSLSLINDNFYSAFDWFIIVKEVNNEQELDNFIKQRYGSGCSIGEKKETNQGGVYAVGVKGDDKDLALTECPVNYGTVIKYFPAENKVASWNLGQEIKFIGKNNEHLDGKMMSSFKFIK